jgi:hypothetical protein
MGCTRVRLQTNSHTTLFSLCSAKMSVQTSLTQRASQPSPLIAACPQLSPFFPISIAVCTPSNCNCGYRRLVDLSSCDLCRRILSLTPDLRSQQPASPSPLFWPPAPVPLRTTSHRPQHRRRHPVSAHPPTWNLLFFWTCCFAHHLLRFAADSRLYR